MCYLLPICYLVYVKEKIKIEHNRNRKIEHLSNVKKEYCDSSFCLTKLLLQYKIMTCDVFNIL